MPLAEPEMALKSILVLEGRVQAISWTGSLLGPPEAKYAQIANMALKSYHNRAVYWLASCFCWSCSASFSSRSASSVLPRSR
jgi:hypothetical protein